MNTFNINELYDKFYSKDYYYLISMSVYHVLIIIFTLVLGVNIPVKTLFLFTWEGLNEHIVNYSLSLNFRNLIMMFIIMFFDFIFLFIISNEINNIQQKNNKKYWFNLTKKRIIIIEILIFFFTLSHPIPRQIMYFLSFNTFQIFITYKIIKYIPFGKFIFLSGSYISLFKLLLFPIIAIYNFHIAVENLTT